MVAVQQDDQRVLLTKRTDDGTWCLPAGSAEPGGSFARTRPRAASRLSALGLIPGALIFVQWRLPKAL
ncbi:MAG: NUDIX domain-containing protein [Solirubrobacterales bacterium]